MLNRNSSIRDAVSGRYQAGGRIAAYWEKSSHSLRKWVSDGDARSHAASLGVVELLCVDTAGVVAVSMNGLIGFLLSTH